MKNLMKNTALVVASVFLALAFASHDAKSEYKPVPQKTVAKKDRNGRWISAGHVERGIASYYNKASVRPYPGKGYLTANGKRFDDKADTAAHRSLPFGTVVKVTDIKTGRWVIVRINDRGPYVEGRIIDLTEGAAEKIGIAGKKGLAKVKMEVIRFSDKTS
ncbi:MAG: septal ring lytic transglycosylase RlpA family protein [Parcubacteria group bacterium]|nr:septal ring lytic transglycosylase RlpA family protein [Parcubacteria group bacterium]